MAAHLDTAEHLDEVYRKAKNHLFHAHGAVRAARRMVGQDGNLGHLRKQLRKDTAALRVEVDQLLVMLRERETTPD